MNLNNSSFDNNTYLCSDIEEEYQQAKNKGLEDLKNVIVFSFINIICKKIVKDKLKSHQIAERIKNILINENLIKSPIENTVLLDDVIKQVEHNFEDIILKYSQDQIIVNNNEIKSTILLKDLIKDQDSIFKINGELIGRGGYGTVSKVIIHGENKELKHEVALKKIWFQSSKYIDIENELELMISLKHKNTISYIKHFSKIEFKDQKETASRTSTNENLIDTNNSSLNIRINICILMELCDSDLKEWLSNRNSENESSIDRLKNHNIIKQILNGLKYLHSKKIFHRDLKPANILLIKNKEDFKIKVSDFGLSRFYDESYSKDEKLSQNIGTEIYMAPEVKTGIYDFKCDMYSIGVILLEMFSIFKTSMERQKVLNSLYEKNLQNDFIEKFPLESKCIEKLKSFDPKIRPGSDILLEEFHCFNLERKSKYILSQSTAYPILQNCHLIT